MATALGAPSVFGYVTGMAISSGAIPARRQPALARLRLAASGALAAIIGALPHVLHHVGPLAGAALFAGLGGSLLFGALGLLAALPMLIRMRRRHGGWRRPLATLAVFAGIFSVSTFVVTPALTPAGDDQSSSSSPAAHDAHHPK